MTAIETGRRHQRVRGSGAWRAPVSVALAGIMLCLAAWFAGSGPAVRKPRVVEPPRSILVVVPARDRAAVHDWCAFFQAYGLSSARDDDSVAGPTLRHLYRQDPKLDFPKNFRIEVFFEPPGTPKVESVTGPGEAAVAAKLRALRDTC